MTKKALQWFKMLPESLKFELLSRYEGNVPTNQNKAIKFIYLNEAHNEKENN